MKTSISRLIGFLTLFTLSALGQEPDTFRAGASSIDITPTEFPVIQNGGFLEGQIQLATEKLHARALALDDGKTQLVMVIVDSCMIPRTLCDEAKALAAQATGLATDKILIAATHTHSAPSVMNYCLGSRADPKYTPFLRDKIVESIRAAVSRLAPAQAAWSTVDAGQFTNCRRWITRLDSLQEDPFGERTVHAMMHPGYQNPAFIGPSGPKDPWLSYLSVQSEKGGPIALLGNFSMHYFSGHAGASADYCGEFARQIAKRLAPQGDSFVGIMSQGTSGDLWYADYGQPKKNREIGEYTKGLVDLVHANHEQLAFRSDITLGMAEKRMTLGRRLPTADRLAWAQAKLKEMDGKRPRNRPEVYAEQALYIHENPTEEIVLQAIRVGELGITAMPNEVYGLTGLKIREQSPLATTFNVELANGAAGYIPPPEQHALGGYNAWPARTAGLEVAAEPKIVDGVLSLLEEVSGHDRRIFRESQNHYTRAILAEKPTLYWQMGEMKGTGITDATDSGHHGETVGKVAYHLPGIAAVGGTLYGSHALHLAGGHVQGPNIPAIENFTALLWLWNGTPEGGTLTKIRETLALGSDGKLVVSQGDQRLAGRAALETRRWYHVALVREKGRVRVHLDGNPVPEINGELNASALPNIQLGHQFQGKLDEFALFDHALFGETIATLYKSASN